MLLLLHLDTFHNMVKLGFPYLFLLIFYHMMHIYIALHLQKLIHVLSIIIQQNLRSHSLLCCIFYIHLYAHLCCNTHMYILVVVVSGSSCIYNSSFCLISAFLVLCFPVSSICPYQISMSTFFHCFSHVRHVTRDSLKIASWHLLHMMFCSSFSVIWYTIVFSLYFVLSEVRNLSVGTPLQWIHSVVVCERLI